MSVDANRQAARPSAAPPAATFSDPFAEPFMQGAGVPDGAYAAVMVDKRDASGRLVARVGMAAGLLDGPCLFYAADGETVVARAEFRGGRPVLPETAPPSFLSGAAVASADASF
ncbi:hypothetical protein [Azospirillum picis]|uniref:Uncharacterized protein n=1 Tax=Azospirillum picis TaxID=488438 RepID=A0ABU0MFL1_9PROT|nr:hypothetical protein [Azospirillum picis]MBP2298723.1 hypothetical protein [Azospirillum picis]MDQ0532228.1 hypothetical protein [Azospirillum picis]